MENLIYLIAFISTTWYGCNLLADVSYDRPLSTHMGYGLISIVSLWQIIPALSIGIIIVFLTYTSIIIVLWVESKKSKNHANNYRSRKKLR